MNQKESFLDSKTILAIALVGVVWMGWQTYLSKKYPQTQASNALSDQRGGLESDTKTEAKTAEKVPSTTPTLSKKTNIIESTEAVETNQFKGSLSSKGLGFTSAQLKNFFDREKNPVSFAVTAGKSLFSMSLNSNEEPVDFKITKIENGFKGEGQVGATTIERYLELDKTGYAIKNRIVFKNPDPSIKSFSLNVPLVKTESHEPSLLSPSYEHQEIFVQQLENSKNERINVDGLSEAIKKDFSNSSVLSVGSQYFSVASVNKSEVSPMAVISAAKDKDIDAKLVYVPQEIKDGSTFEFVTYVGPKSHDLLMGIDASLVSVLDFGFFSGIGKILLVVLKWFNQFVGNWGISIILLTLVVRVLVLPFNIASFKSMKKMQAVQPMMQSLRERYKDDPTSLNREMMVLMKEHKVNPLGGCLPMLLQMPVFFALFQVLGHSVELYQAPFFGWIHDLSLKDPLYILPVLMGVSFWYQQKSTPTTMDPAQAKVMQFMPIIFSLMMISLPSGLTLYTLISTVFGIAQQKFFMASKSPEAVKA